MWIKLLQISALSLSLHSSVQASEGQFTLVPQGGKVPFEATCFDDVATAKLLTWKELLVEEMKEKCSFEKQKIILEKDLDFENLQITLDETNFRYQAELSARDNEIEKLRDIIKRSNRANVPVIIVISATVGFGIGAGTYHIILSSEK